jgi:D-xylose transport system substrate-binding protein
MNDQPLNTSESEPTITPSSTSMNMDAPTAPPQASGLNTEPKPTKKKTKKWLVLAAIGLVIVVALAVFAFLLSRTPAEVTTEPSIRIGLSLDNYQESRWEKDKQYLEEYAEDSGAKLTTVIADGDAELQIEQVENLISQKVDVLIIVPHDAESIAPVIEKAHTAGIKVLSYDRLILNSDVDIYVSFDNEQVGKNSAQYVVDALAAKNGAKIAYVGGAPTDNNATLIKKGAMSVLTPLIESGKVELVYDVPTIEWKPDLAYVSLKAFLDKGNTVDGVIAGNDGTAFGALRALQESSITGIPITGQDAELPAIQRLIAGTQLMTNYKSIKSLAAKTIDIAVDLANGKTPEQNATIANGFKDVPSFLLTPVPVTKTNINETVIEDEFYTEAQVYGTGV